MPNEEFDIMKPISPHLDIGTTMFDEPHRKSDDLYTGGNSQNTQNEKNAQPAESRQNSTPQYTGSASQNTQSAAPAEEGGRADLNYGFVTAEEAELLELPEETGSPDAPQADNRAVSAEAGTPLFNAIEGLEEVLREYNADIMEIRRNAGYISDEPETEPTPEEKKEEWLPDTTVRLNGRRVHGKKKNAVIAMLFVFLAVFFILAVAIIMFLVISASA